MFELRPYQVKAIQDLRTAVQQGHKRVLLYMPTGGGKTACATEIIRSAVSKGNSALFVCHRRELVHQCSNKLTEIGVPHGLILAGEEPSHYDPVQVAAIQTLHARAFARKRMKLPPASVLILDECHHALAKTWTQLTDAYPDAVVIGLTATPVRGDGRGLGHIFEHMVMSPTIGELTQLGYLVPVRYFAPSMPDLEGVKVRAGDYVQEELGKAMDKPKLIGDIVTNFLRICPDRQTVLFASSVAHSIHAAEAFNAAGIKAAHLDGNTPADLRDATLNDLRHKRIQILCNCMLVTEGWDYPAASCAILARPTKSVGLYLQMAGRVLRPFPGKSDTILIDHSGAVYEHGLLTDFVEWNLDTEGKIQDRQAEIKAKEPKPITCSKCHAVYTGQLVCPSCGHVPERKGRSVEFIDADLTEVIEDRAKKHEHTMAEKGVWYGMLKQIAQERSYNLGWAAHKYREKFGVWPNGLKQAPALVPSPEVLSWVRSRQIRWAKGSSKPPKL